LKPAASPHTYLFYHLTLGSGETPLQKKEKVIQAENLLFLWKRKYGIDY
jgi:hypothetical protein